MATDPEAARRLHTDPAAFAAEYGLDADDLAALQALRHDAGGGRSDVPDRRLSKSSLLFGGAFGGSVSDVVADTPDGADVDDAGDPALDTSAQDMKDAAMYDPPADLKDADPGAVALTENGPLAGQGPVGAVPLRDEPIFGASEGGGYAGAGAASFAGDPTDHDRGFGQGGSYEDFGKTGDEPSHTGSYDERQYPDAGGRGTHGGVVIGAYSDRDEPFHDGRGTHSGVVVGMVDDPHMDADGRGTHSGAVVGVTGDQHLDADGRGTHGGIVTGVHNEGTGGEPSGSGGSDGSSAPPAGSHSTSQAGSDDPKDSDTDDDDEDDDDDSGKDDSDDGDKDDAGDEGMDAPDGGNDGNTGNSLPEAVRNASGGTPSEAADTGNAPVQGFESPVSGGEPGTNGGEGDDDGSPRLSPSVAGISVGTIRDDGTLEGTPTYGAVDPNPELPPD